MGRQRGKLAKEYAIEARRITVNAIVAGNRVTLFDGRGGRIAAVSLAALEESEDVDLCDTWKWQAMLQIYLWKLKQQMWKAEQDPWTKKAIHMANTLRGNARSRVSKNEKSGRPRLLPPTSTWREAIKRMAVQASTHAKPQMCRWQKWCSYKASALRDDSKLRPLLTPSGDTEHGKDQESIGHYSLSNDGDA